VRHRRHHPVVTKHNELVTRPEDIPLAIRQAFHIATTGRPGPVLVDIPKDIVDPKNPASAMDWDWPTDADVASSLPGYKPTTKGHPRKIKEAAELILGAQRPVIYAGGGILKARAAEVLRELAELTDIPVVTTLMARGAFPDDHPLCLGMPGMHGNYTAVTAMQRVRPAHRSRQPLRRPRHRQGRRLRPRREDHPRRHRPGRARQGASPRRADRRRLPPGDRGDGPAANHLHRRRRGGPPTRPQRVEAGDLGLAGEVPAGLRAVGRRRTAQAPVRARGSCATAPPRHCIVASGVGQHQMWASQYWKFNHPYTWVNSGGLGTMGFSVPAAIGAKVGRPDRMVWAVDGDGCFQMTAQELVTAATERIPVKVAILNNAYLGMVRQWQEMFYEERYSEVYLSPDLPDYVKWAEAMGCVAMRVESPEEVGPAIDKANEIDDRPGRARVPHRRPEKVFPMVPAGKSNDEIVVDPSLREGDR
jgi:acetolactate synthase-1/2/3 large subunit